MTLLMAATDPWCPCAYVFPTVTSFFYISSGLYFCTHSPIHKKNAKFCSEWKFPALWYTNLCIHYGYIYKMPCGKFLNVLKNCFLDLCFLPIILEWICSLGEQKVPHCWLVLLFEEWYCLHLNYAVNFILCMSAMYHLIYFPTCWVDCKSK